MLQRVMRKVRNEGIVSLSDAAGRYLRNGAIAGFSSVIHPATSGKLGIEIGGPSHRMFGPGGYLPIYEIASRVDCCNFSDNTAWEGRIVEGNTFYFDPKRSPGHQYVNDGTDLWTIPSGRYDFLISSHTLEHIANPLKALHEWRRVVKRGGLLLIVVPQKERIFDHKRETTPLYHMVQDYGRNVAEDDLTHLEEIIAHHDRSMDKASGDAEHFKKRSHDNFNNRCLHHHTFSLRSFCELLQCAGLHIVLNKAQMPWHLIAVCRN